MKDNKLNILIADDEPITRMDLRELLQESGYNVVAEAGDGFDAVEACKKHHPDLVLMDIQMPIMNGNEALRELRRKEQGLACHMPVIAQTAYALREEHERFLQEGFDGYVSKPLDIKELIYEMKRVTRVCISDAVPPERINDGF